MDQHDGIRVSIYDQVYQLRSGPNRAHQEEVARYVDQRMHAIADRTGTVDSLRVAVLAALHIADELFRMRRDYQRLEGGVEATSMRCAALLDEAFEQAPAAGA